VLPDNSYIFIFNKKHGATHFKEIVFEVTATLRYCLFVLGWVTAYKRMNHTKDWLALLLARCCIAS
jgi:hypothetical protein